MRHRTSSRAFAVSAAVAALVGLAAPAAAAPVYEFATPVFGLDAGSGGHLYVADYGAGIVRLGDTGGRLAVELPGVTDTATLEPGRMWALTSAARDRKLYQVVDGTVREIANLRAFEKTVNPDDGEIDSNPFDLAKLGGGEVLVADAAANALLIANRKGDLDWVATLPEQVVSTTNAKDLAGCPDPPPELADICDLPAEMPAQPVTTSVAVGPDGAYYLTELKGFPAPLGESRIWRIEPGTLNAHCDAAATDSPCSIVADGFTSIVDLNFGPDGKAHVVEIDEASWLAVELGGDAAVGGTVNVCDSTAWTCTEEAVDLQIPTAVAIKSTGAVHVTVSALVPGEADVIELA